MKATEQETAFIKNTSAGKDIILQAAGTGPAANVGKYSFSCKKFGPKRGMISKGILIACHSQPRHADT